MLRAAVFVAALSPAMAQAVTISGADLVAAETMVDGEFGYQISLAGLGFESITSITLTDAQDVQETGGTTAGFDIDALTVGATFDTGASADSYLFTRGGNNGAVLDGTNPDGSLNEADATLGTYDAQAGSLGGYLSMGNGGILTAEFSGAGLAVTDGDSIFLRDIGGNEFLASVVIGGVRAPVPLPAGGILMLGGLATTASAMRRRATVH